VAARAEAAVCHIHPPGEALGDGSAKLIGPYPDAHRCERERQLRFGAAGRCHCAAPFTPDWLGRRAVDRPTPAVADPSLQTPGGAPGLPLP
ncbi:MAG: hypothetical protein PVF12_06185, partial [Thiohalocapsa sp.]